MSQQQPFGHDPRLVAQDRKRAIHRSDRVILELPDIVSGMPVFAMASHSFAAPYATGGMTIVPPLPEVPNLSSVFAFPKGGYTFEFSAPDKLFAYFGGGGEVADTTDLSFLGTTPVLVQGSRGDALQLVMVSESWRVSAASLEVGEDVVRADASWLMRLQVVRRTGEVDLLGAIDTFETTLFAGERYDFFSAQGLGDSFDLLAGDALRLHLTQSGAAPAIARPVVTIKRRKL